MINKIKATLFHPDYPVILSNLFPLVNYYLYFYTKVTVKRGLRKD